VKWWLAAYSLLKGVVSLNVNALWGELTMVLGKLVMLTSTADSVSDKATVFVIPDRIYVPCCSGLPCNGATELAQEGSPKEAAAVPGSQL
jgi:hypothetical protein